MKDKKNLTKVTGRVLTGIALETDEEKVRNRYERSSFRRNLNAMRGGSFRYFQTFATERPVSEDMYSCCYCIDYIRGVPVKTSERMEGTVVAVPAGSFFDITFEELRHVTGLAITEENWQDFLTPQSREHRENALRESKMIPVFPRAKEECAYGGNQPLDYFYFDRYSDHPAYSEHHRYVAYFRRMGKGYAAFYMQLFDSDSRDFQETAMGEDEIDAHMNEADKFMYSCKGDAYDHYLTETEAGYFLNQFLELFYDWEKVFSKEEKEKDSKKGRGAFLKELCERKEIGDFAKKLRGERDDRSSIAIKICRNAKEYDFRLRGDCSSNVQHLVDIIRDIARGSISCEG